MGVYIRPTLKFVNIESISILVSHIENEDQLLIWKTKNNGKILPSDKSFKKKPLRGDITSNSYMFHSKYKNYAIWDNKAGSDFRVLEKLMKLNLKIVWINNILTKVNNIDGMVKHALANNVMHSHATRHCILLPPTPIDICACWW